MLLPCTSSNGTAGRLEIVWPDAEALAIMGRSPNKAREASMYADHLAAIYADCLAAAERKAVLDAILTALWKGELTRTAAAYRIMDKLGLSERDARAEIDAFLRDRAPVPQ